MTDQESWEKVEAALAGAILVNGILTTALTAVLAITNQEVPDFKERSIAFIRQIRSNHPDGQAMVDGAVRLFQDLEDH
jgi:hypothetical protein